MNVMYTRIGSLVFLVLFCFTGCKKTDDAVLAPSVPIPIPAALPDSPVTLVLKPVSKSIGTEIGGYYQALPSNYDSTNQLHPVIIFLHGAAQLGNGKGELSRLLFYGTMNYIKSGLIPPTFSNNNKDYSFLYLAPQFKANFSVDDL